MDYFNTGLALSLFICCAGAIRRGAVRYRRRIGKSDAQVSESSRPALSWAHRIAAGSKALVLDVLLLTRTGRRSLFRWTMHTLILVGFMGLLLFHAMDGVITVPLFPGYESTLNPWQFLRNLFGLMALVGIVMAVVRRLRDRRLRDRLLGKLSRFQDWALLFVIGSILVSGFVLEAVKITSEPVFDRMVDDFFYAEETGDMQALKSYWADEYGSVFSQPVSVEPDVLERGAELNEESCAACHSDTASAFVSRPLAMVLKPTGNLLALGRADLFFRYLHTAFCFLGLALLPWAKFFHPIATPLNLVHRGRSFSSEAGKSISRMVFTGPGLDACTRCGECSLHCSVRPIFDVLGNPDLLPSEKLADLKRYVTDKRLDDRKMAALAEGSRLCTECLRCTDICPSGIDLQALWIGSKPEMKDPNYVVRSLPPAELAVIFGDAPPGLVLERVGLQEGKGAADHSDSFQGCVQCTTCTSVCPVVAVSDNPTRDLDLTPQQIMNMLRMGLKDRTLGARMVWSCTTCYKCSEHCPQGLPVADILYELRNTAAARLRSRDHDSLFRTGAHR